MFVPGRSACAPRLARSPFISAAPPIVASARVVALMVPVGMLLRKSSTPARVATGLCRTEAARRFARRDGSQREPYHRARCEAFPVFNRFLLALGSPPAGLGGGSMKKYWRLFNVGIQNTLVYRVNFIFRSVFGLIPLFATLSLWRAVYSGNPGNVAGYTLGSMISYYLVVTIVDALTAVTEDGWQ